MWGVRGGGGGGESALPTDTTLSVALAAATPWCTPADSALRAALLLPCRWGVQILKTAWDDEESCAMLLAKLGRKF